MFTELDCNSPNNYFNKSNFAFSESGSSKGRSHFLLELYACLICYNEERFGYARDVENFELFK